MHMTQKSILEQIGFVMKKKLPFFFSFTKKENIQMEESFPW